MVAHWKRRRSSYRILIFAKVTFQWPGHSLEYSIQLDHEGPVAHHQNIDLAVADPISIHI